MGAFTKGNQAWKNREQNRVLTDALRRALARYESKERNIKPGEAAEKIAYQIVEAAVDGDKWAQQFAWERTEGKAHQTSEITVNRPTNLEDIPTNELERIAFGRTAEGCDGTTAASGSLSGDGSIH